MFQDHPRLEIHSEAVVLAEFDKYSNRKDEVCESSSKKQANADSGSGRDDLVKVARWASDPHAPDKYHYADDVEKERPGNRRRLRYLDNVREERGLPHKPDCW